MGGAPTPATTACATEVTGYKTGHKSVHVEVTAGGGGTPTPAIKVMCRGIAGNTSLLQEGTTLSASGVREYDTWCDAHTICVNDCGGCSISAWVRADPIPMP